MTGYKNGKSSKERKIIVKDNFYNIAVFFEGEAIL